MVKTRKLSTIQQGTLLYVIASQVLILTDSYTCTIGGIHTRIVRG
jgi:hypothetical protein